MHSIFVNEYNETNVATPHQSRFARQLPLEGKPLQKEHQLQRVGVLLFTFPLQYFLMLLLQPR